METVQVQANEYKKKNDELAIEAGEKEAALEEAENLRKEQLGTDFDTFLEEYEDARAALDEEKFEFEFYKNENGTSGEEFQEYKNRLEDAQQAFDDAKWRFDDISEQKFMQDAMDYELEKSDERNRLRDEAEEERAGLA